MSESDLKSMTEQELIGLAESLGQPAYRGRQLFGWLQAPRMYALSDMHTLPKAFREKLAAYSLPLAEVRDRRESADGSAVKYLCSFSDGTIIETVAMRYRYGWSACLSTQAGCRMGCRFCVSTQGGLLRDLTAGEMIAQLQIVGEDLAGRDERPSRVVLMGSGEPLENIEAVIRFLRVVHDAKGWNMGYRHITLSTCGLVDAIGRLAGEGLPVTLAVSLHAPDDDLRKWLMPGAARHSVREVIEAASAYQEQTGRRVSYEYTMIRDVNDRVDQAKALGELLKGRGSHVNLISLHPGNTQGLQPSGPEAIERFCEALNGMGVNATIRRSLGEDIQGACGQLRHQYMQGR